jgi:hypothetical protein
MQLVSYFHNCITMHEFINFKFMTYNIVPIYKLTLTYPRTEKYELPLYYDVHYMGTGVTVEECYC